MISTTGAQQHSLSKQPDPSSVYPARQWHVSFSLWQVAPLKQVKLIEAFFPHFAKWNVERFLSIRRIISKSSTYCRYNRHRRIRVGIGMICGLYIYLLISSTILDRSVLRRDQDLSASMQSGGKIILPILQSWPRKFSLHWHWWSLHVPLFRQIKSLAPVQKATVSWYSARPSFRTYIWQCSPSDVQSCSCRKDHQAIGDEKWTTFISAPKNQTLNVRQMIGQSEMLVKYLRKSQQWDVCEQDRSIGSMESNRTSSLSSTTFSLPSDTSVRATGRKSCSQLRARRIRFCGNAKQNGNDICSELVFD